MPNHVAHRVIVTGPEVELERFKATCFDADGGFDFNTLIPMPEALKNSDESSDAEFGMKLIITRAEANSIETMQSRGFYENWIKRWAEEHNIPAGTGAAQFAAIVLEKEPRFEEAGKKRLRIIEETGFASWYPWAIANWGTKWGAYSTSQLEQIDGGIRFSFDTAWSPPEPIFEKLAEEFPQLTFDIAYFDEGWNFAGHIRFTGDDHETLASEANDELYEIVYGTPPEEYDED